MSHILKRKIKNVIYVYEEKSYRDKFGRPRTKQKCLGKLDKNGKLIASRKRLREKNLPAIIVEYIITTRKFNIKPITRKKPLHNSRPAKKFAKTSVINNKNHKLIARQRA